MARVTRRLMEQMQNAARERQQSGQIVRPPLLERGLRLVKLDDHLPAPTDNFEATDFTPTTVTAKYTRRTGQLRDTNHYELNDAEDDDGNGLITVVNRFPWVWEYKHEYIWVERFNGEWIPRQPHYSIVLVHLTEAISKNSSGQVEAYWSETGTKSSETGTGLFIEDVHNRYVDAADDAEATIQWHNNGWELRTLECFE